jgi:hypothetical protein
VYIVYIIMSDSTNSSVMISPVFVKPLVSGVSAFLFDKFLLGNTDTKSCAVFGGAVLVGTGLSQAFTGLDLGLLPDSQIYTGKSISQRAIEITLATGASYAGNRFILQNDMQPSMISQKVGIILLSQFIGEYTSDYFGNAPLSYLM